MLDLNDLPREHGDTGTALALAGAICLESQNHSPGVALDVRGNADGTCARSYHLNWTPTASGDDALWQYNRATEMGAEAVAILLVKNETPYQAIEAAILGTGIDFWLGEDSDLIFQRKARLEVSGIRSGNDTAIARRVRDKLTQTNQSDHSQTTAYVIVVEFSQPVAEIRVK